MANLNAIQNETDYIRMVAMMNVLLVVEDDDEVHSLSSSYLL